jgi:hypothetical protein
MAGGEPGQRSDSLRARRSGDRIQVGSRFSAPVQTGSEAHPTSYTMGTGSFPGGKAVGAWRWPPTPSSAEVKGRVKLYLYSPSGPLWTVLGWTLPLHGRWISQADCPATDGFPLTPRQKRGAPYDAYLSSSVFIPRWWYRTVYSSRFVTSPVCSLVPIGLSVVFDYVLAVLPAKGASRNFRRNLWELYLCKLNLTYVWEKACVAPMKLDLRLQTSSAIWSVGKRRRLSSSYTKTYATQ